MLPEQHDILWTFCALAFAGFSVYAFINVIGHCRERDDVNTKLWGGIFGAFVIVSLIETSHMFDLAQGDQISFFFNWQVLTVFLLLLAWGIFFKSQKIENQSPPIIRAFFFWTIISVLLAGYTNWLPQQRSDPPPKVTAVSADLTMEEYAEMGRIIVFGAKQVAGQKSIGKGQCPLCHTFEPGNDIGRCPNLFGVEDRSHKRIKEERYLNEPIKIGEEDPASHVVKGKPMEIDPAYRREGGPDMIGEDYLRESIMCPSCYVVKGFGKAGDTKSPMPVITKPPISLSPVEVNAVIAWLQSKDTPGDFANVTVPLPSEQATAEKKEEGGGEEEEKPVFVTGNEPIDQMINTLGCPLCHTIPGIEGAVGELGPKLYEKINAPKRLKDPNYKGKAKTPRDYTKESILNPGAYVVFNEEAGESFPDGLMPTTFSQMLSVKALDKLVDFISETEPPAENK
ncbi:MAG: cytochrome C [Nitrospinaceae bacterium]